MKTLVPYLGFPLRQVTVVVGEGWGYWTGTRMLNINFRLPNLFIIQERQVHTSHLPYSTYPAEVQCNNLI
jgi:hypothetical protein